MDNAIIQALRRARQAYMTNVGEPAAQLVGGSVRGYLGLDAPGYADSRGMEAYRNAQALGNAPGVGAPAGAFKAMAAAPLVVKALRRAPRDEALETARQNAVKMLGLPENNTAMDRARALGFIEQRGYHGTVEDVPAFDPRRFGQATGAPSASQGVFVAMGPAGASKGGASTASQYAMIGDRTSNRLNREMQTAERRGNWDAYKKATQKLEDYELGKVNLANKANDELDKIRDGLGVLREAYKYEGPSLQELTQFYPHETALKMYRDSVNEHLVKSGLQSNQRYFNALLDKYRSAFTDRLSAEIPEGANVMPLMVRPGKSVQKDFGGSIYRDETFNDVIQRGFKSGNDTVVLRNTYDPGVTSGPFGSKPDMLDVMVVKDPARLRSQFAAFDPARVNENDLLGRADPRLLAAVATGTGATAATVAALRDKKEDEKKKKKAQE